MVVEMEKLRMYWDGEGPDVSDARNEIERGIVQIGGPEAQTKLADAIAELQASYSPRRLGQASSASSGASPSPSAASGVSASPGRAFFQPPPSPLNPGQDAAATPEAAGMEGMDNLRLAHELLLNPEQFQLPAAALPQSRRPASAPPAPSATDTESGMDEEQVEAALIAQVERQARAAFWSLLREQLGATPPKFDMLIGLLEEVFTGLSELAPDSPTWAKMLGRCDLALLRQQAEHGAVGIEDLLHALSIATEALAVGGSVEAEDEARAWSSAVLEAVGEAAAQDGLNGLAATLPPVFEGFWERLEALREAAVAFRLAPALDALAQHGTEYERAAFERDFPPGSALPKTEEWLAGIPAPAKDVSKTVAAGVAQLISSTDPDYPLAETLHLDVERLENLHEQASRLATVAAVGLMVKQALTKAGLPVHLIAQVVDEPSLAPQQQPKERIDRSDEPNLVPVLRTGRGGLVEPAGRLEPEDQSEAKAVQQSQDEASPIARRMLPDLFHVLEPPVPPTESVQTVIDGGCSAVCAGAGVPWTDSQRSALQEAARGVLEGTSPVLAIMRKRLGSALAAAMCPDGRVSEMTPSPAELKKHGLAAVALPLVQLATAGRAVCEHQCKVHGPRLAAMLATM